MTPNRETQGAWDDPAVQKAVRDLLAEDAAQWPDGHPCRYCGRLAKDHHYRSTDTCDGWR